MCIDNIYKDLVSLKRVCSSYVLYGYDTSTGKVKTYIKSPKKSDMETYIKENDLVKIPYSLFIEEGKRLSHYLKSQE